jgi:hypothetical protein
VYLKLKNLGKRQGNNVAPCYGEKIVWFEFKEIITN